MYLMNIFNDPIFGIAVMFVGAMLGFVVINRDLFFTKKKK